MGTLYPKREFDAEALRAYKEKHPEIMKEVPVYERGGKLLVMNSRDYNMMWLARTGHFKTVQLTEKGNFSARLPLEKRLQKLMYSCTTILVKSTGPHYHVVKDYGGEFFNNKPITIVQAKETFGVQQWVEWKFPRKVKKEYKHFAEIGKQLELNERTSRNDR